MFRVSDLINYVKKRGKLVAALVAFNVLVSCVVVPRLLREVYEAEVQVVFNQVKHNFEENRATDYLFNDNEHRENHYEFVNILKSDSLMALTVNRYKLADHFGVDPQDPNRVKKAAEILRRKIRFRIEKLVIDPSLTLYLKDGDVEMAELVLMDLVVRVKDFYKQRMYENNAVTKEVAQTHIEDIESSLPEIRDQIGQIPDAELSSKERSKLSQAFYRNKLSEKFKLVDLIQQIDANDKSMQYQPYWIINNGVRNVSYSLAFILMMALLANVLSLIIELQFAYIVSYFRAV